MIIPPNYLWEEQHQILNKWSNQSSDSLTISSNLIEYSSFGLFDVSFDVLNWPARDLTFCSYHSAFHVRIWLTQGFLAHFCWIGSRSFISRGYPRIPFRSPFWDSGFISTYQSRENLIAQHLSSVVAYLVFWSIQLAAIHCSTVLLNVWYYLPNRLTFGTYRSPLTSVTGFLLMYFDVVDFVPMCHFWHEDSFWTAFSMHLFLTSLGSPSMFTFSLRLDITCCVLSLVQLVTGWWPFLTPLRQARHARVSSWDLGTRNILRFCGCPANLY